MWIEIEVLLKDKIVNWQDLGFEIKHDFARRMVKLEEVYYLQAIALEAALGSGKATLVEFQSPF